MYSIKIKTNPAFLGIFFTLLCIQCKTNKKENPGDSNKTFTAVTIETEDFREYYPSGNLKLEGQFIGEEKTGEWISYHENGEQQSIRNYKRGVLDGYQKMEYSQVLFMEGFFKNGTKIGTWKSYFKENNAPKYLKHFDDSGKATGEWRSYYDSGELVSIENYLNNKAHGKQTEYFKNGTISSVGEKQDGRENGIWKYYFDDGTLMSEREFKNGVDHGIYIEYFKNGTVYKTGTKHNFKKNGTWKTYDDQGNLVETVLYDYGKPQ